MKMKKRIEKKKKDDEKHASLQAFNHIFPWISLEKKGKSRKKENGGLRSRKRRRRRTRTRLVAYE